jgi:hypothetical protein
LNIFISLLDIKSWNFINYSREVSLSWSLYYSIDLVFSSGGFPLLFWSCLPSAICFDLCLKCFGSRFLSLFLVCKDLPKYFLCYGMTSSKREFGVDKMFFLFSEQSSIFAGSFSLSKICHRIFALDRSVSTPDQQTTPLFQNRIPVAGSLSPPTNVIKVLLNTQRSLMSLHLHE